MVTWLRSGSLYAPSPCHMHPGHNCRHIKSCPPPDKQYTEFIIYTCSLFFIWNNKVSMARGALWDGLLILYTGQCLPQDTSLEVSLPCSLSSSLNPSSARFLPPAVHASSRPFLARQLHQSSLPQPSIPPLTLSACLASSLPPSPCSRPNRPSPCPSLPLSLPPPPSLPPSIPILVPSLLHPPSLAPSFPPSFLPR